MNVLAIVMFGIQAALALIVIAAVVHSILTDKTGADVFGPDF